MSRPRASVLGLLAVLLALAGCTGIPDSSAPQVVRSIHPSPTDTPHVHITPRPDEGPSDVVRDFVETGVDADAGHSSSRQFLTTGAARRWQDNPTVILDEAIVRDVSVSNSSATVVVTGRRMGSLDASGAFTPILKGMGTGEEEKFTFRLLRQSGQWQIDVLQPGVLINFPDFRGDYNQYALYFLDPGGTLVPDLRYSPLQGQALASWLLTGLLAGPGQELAQAVVNEVPDQVGKPTVQLGDPIVVEMPGSAQLKGDDRDGLAKQLAYTLEQARFGRLELTDGGKPVRVPAASGLQFGSSDFADDNPDNPSGGGLYFVRSGAVVDSKGVPLANLPSRNFSSVALLHASGESLTVAGLTTAGQLLIGDDRGLAPVSVPQPVTSRPEWRPNTEDVWFGAGRRGGIYRVTTGGPVQPVSVSSQVGPLPTGPVMALRFSSDGDRVAVVIRGVNGIGSTWIGSVVTSGADVRIDALEPITPPSLAVTDLAWAAPGTLYLVAAAPGAEARVWEMSSDGSHLDDDVPISGLPGPPTAITAEPPQSPVVSAGGGIWSLSGSTWISVVGAGTTRSSNPVYAR